MNTIENGFSLRQPESLNGLLANSGHHIYSRLLKLDSISLQILKAVGENPGIRSKELEVKINLSRAPILQRTKKLSEDALLSRSIVAGTENHSKPTYSYSLPPGITLIAVTCAIAKVSLEEYLKLEGKGLTEDSKPEVYANGHQNQQVSFQAFQDLQVVLEAALRKIAELEGRLNRVEDALRQPSTFDREKLLGILQPSKI